MGEWICTKCAWHGKYEDTMPVMYHAIDWQNCPSCNSVAIPIAARPGKKDAFKKLWDNKPWWPEGTADKKMALHYFLKGVDHTESELRDAVLEWIKARDIVKRVQPRTFTQTFHAIDRLKAAESHMQKLAEVK